MSEHVKRHETHGGHEQTVSHEHQAELLKQKHEEAEKAHHEAAKHSVEDLRKKVAEQAPEGSLLAAHKHDKQPEEATFASHHGLKKASYKQSLQEIRRQLPKPLRSFSKFIHNSNIETISNISAQTVARPSGLFGGGLGAFVGSALLLFMSKYYGFEYNYSVFLVLFLGGFVAGLALELLVWLVRRQRRA